MLILAKVFVDSDRRALAISNAVDNQPGAENTVAAGENAAAEVISVCGIDRDQTAWRSFDLIFGCEKSRRGACPIAMMRCRTRSGFSLPSKNAGLKAFVLIEDPLGLKSLECGRPCRLLPSIRLGPRPACSC